MTMVAPNIAMRAQVGPYGATAGSLRGYYVTLPRRGMGSYPKAGGLGQHWYDGILNAAENVAGGLPIDAPTAGGGWVSTADGTQYVNQAGENQSTPDPGAGITPSLLPTLPSWVVPTVGIVAILLLLGYSGIGRTAAAVASRANRSHRSRRRHLRNRRGRRGRR